MADDPRHWVYCACGLRLPVKTVLPSPRAPGAHAVSGFIVCPVCDTLPDPHRPAFKKG